MVIEKKIKNLDKKNAQLISHGYATCKAYQFSFFRYVSDDSKKENLRKAKKLSCEEWEAECDRVGWNICRQMQLIVDKLAREFSIYQYDPGVKYGKHELFFWSNRGWNKKEWYDHFSLTLNQDKSCIEQEKILERVTEILLGIKSPQIRCQIEYMAVLDEDKICKDAECKYQELSEKRVYWAGMEGRIYKFCSSDKTEYRFYQRKAGVGRINSHFLSIPLTEMVFLEEALSVAGVN